jgi:GntR family transcriptional regulator
MNYDAKIPIYLQIIDAVKKEIVTGKLSRGGRLDSVRSLAEKYEVNMVTMQRACSELERLGIIYTRRGVGSFVSEDEDVVRSLKAGMSAGLMKSFLDGMESLGYDKTEIFEMIKKELGL